jgi:transposase
LLARNSYFDSIGSGQLVIERAAMNKLDKKRRAQVVAALVEGASVNSVVLMTGVSKPTILKLLADLGTACAKYQDEKLRNLPCKRVQADEI